MLSKRNIKEAAKLLLAEPIRMTVRCSLEQRDCTK